MDEAFTVTTNFAEIAKEEENALALPYAFDFL